jgi:hypothetical protein
MAYSNAVDNTAVERNERIVDEVLPAATSSVTAKDIPSALSGSKRSGLTLADVPSVLSGSRRSGLTEGTGVLPTPTLAPLAVDTSHLDTAYKRTIVLDGHGAPSSNVRTDDERKSHSRRRQLRKAFSRANKEEM